MSGTDRTHDAAERIRDAFLTDRQQREKIDELFGQNCILETQRRNLLELNRALIADLETALDLVKLLLMPSLSDAQLKRKVKRLERVKAIVH